MQRIAVLGLTLALTAVAAVPQGRAGDFPSRPIHLIIGFPPGSAADITARLVGNAMSQTLGQQIVIESRPGAGSSIAAEFVARAPKDGYTLYIGTSSNVTNDVRLREGFRSGRCAVHSASFASSTKLGACVISKAYSIP